MPVNGDVKGPQKETRKKGSIRDGAKGQRQHSRHLLIQKDFGIKEKQHRDGLELKRA